jgi:hypothetical protein
MTSSPLDHQPSELRRLLVAILVGGNFPMTSSLHVGTSDRTSTVAVGQVTATAAIGQLAGPLVVGVVAEVTSLRVGLIMLPALTLLAGVALACDLHAHGPS